MNIYESITAAMQDGYAIGKDSVNKQQGFKYRGIDAVMNVFQPILSRHKIFLVPEVLDERRDERQTKNGGNLIYTVLRVKYTFYAEDGSSVSAVVVGEGMDSADKSANKALAVAMKYAMFQIFCIPTEDMKDPDADSYDIEPRSSSQGTSKHICADCGKPLRDSRSQDGRLWSADDIACYSKRRYGRIVCDRCMAAAEKALNDGN